MTTTHFDTPQLTSNLRALTASPVKVGQFKKIGSAAALMLPVLMLLISSGPAMAEEIGSVNTKFKVFGSDKVVIDAFDDPKVDGVTCYVSRAKTGGISGSLGLAEDTADASIACRQVGPIKVKEPLLPSDEVFNERRSLIFKSLQVVRFVDQRRNALVYLTYSDRVLEGSPKNSITAVPVLEGQKIPVKK